MKYAELLEETRKRKYKAIRELNAALKGPMGFLVKAEIERKPGVVAWHYLAKEFVEQLAEHIDEFIAEGDDVAGEVQEIYMAYEDGDSNLYDLLPVEAQLFEEEA